MSENITEEKTKKPRKWFTIIGYVFIILIVLVLVLVLGLKMTKKNVFIFNRMIVWVMTESMEPEIPAKSYIVVKKASASEIEVGDIILFRSDDPDLHNGNNTHRVIEIVGDNEEFVTKGDNNAAKDKYTAKADNIIGVYVGIVPVLSEIGRVLFSSMGMIVVIAVLFGLIMIVYIPEIIKATRALNEEIDKREQERIDKLVQEEVEKLKAANAKETPPKEEEKPEDKGPEE